jgi:hypothetical protein
MNPATRPQPSSGFDRLFSAPFRSISAGCSTSSNPTAQDAPGDPLRQRLGRVGPVLSSLACPRELVPAHLRVGVDRRRGQRAKAITTFMGHTNISTTFDLYGHLMPGGEDAALVLIDAYYERVNMAPRLGVGTH